MTGSVEFIKELTGFQGNACLVRRGEDYFVVSSVDAMFTGPETLVFASDDKGEPTSWTDIAGGRGVSRAEAIAELEASELEETAEGDAS